MMDQHSSEEIWKPVKEFEELYHISSYGRLKSFKKYKNGYILSQTNKNNGYFSIILSDFNTKKVKHTRIHRLVAETFIENPNNKNVVNHIDCNKQNNRVENLEWVTQKENFEHAYFNKLVTTKGLYNYNNFIKPKIVYQVDLEGNFIKSYENCKIASLETGICHRNILQVARKEEYKPGKIRKQAGGFIWTFKEGDKND